MRPRLRLTKRSTLAAISRAWRRLRPAARLNYPDYAIDASCKLPTSQPQPGSLLPALRIDGRGRRCVDYRAVIMLALPLFLNSGLQALLNLTDAWFIGRISTDATAAMGALYFLVTVFILLLSGVGMGVQTLVAQAYGSGHKTRAAAAVWTGCWSALLTTPLFVLLAVVGRWLLAPFELAPNIEYLALEYWFPRLLGGPLAVAIWALTGFFNGIGRTQITLAVAISVTAVNTVLNELFMFWLGLGMAGAAWATTASLLLGLVLMVGVFLSAGVRASFKSHQVWQPQWRNLRRLFALGLPIGLFMVSDLVGLALFQIMTVKLGVVDGAATQIVMMLTSTAYMPALGVAQAGTTLVGQSIGAGDKRWAMRIGNTVILLLVAYMGLVGVFLAFAGAWLIPLFTSAADAYVPEVIALGQTLLWFVAGYQVFHALSIGSTFCLQGAGDVKVPAVLSNGLSWFGFVPLTHMLSFKLGQGWVDFLPQYGLGVLGGWGAFLAYMVVMGVLLSWRWRSGAWRRFALY
jgi:MATE family multidrug resistance protein